MLFRSQPAGVNPVGAAEGAYLQAAVDLEHQHSSAALKAYDAAVKRWPNSLAAWMGLGNIRYALADISGAAKAFEQANTIHPDAAEPLNNLAQVRLQQGEFDAAIEAIEKALQLDQNSELYQQTRREIMRLSNMARDRS